MSICLPDRLHEEAAVAAAEAGKAILLEKPLAHDAAAARRIVAAVERAGVRLMVGHILRFDPRYVQVFHAAAPERLGAPIHLRAKRNGIRSTAARLGAASSILFYMGVHDVDAMQWIARSRIARVYAQKVERLGTGNEDALYAVVNFENGAIGSIDYSWAWPDGLMNGFRSALRDRRRRGRPPISTARTRASTPSRRAQRPAATRICGPRSTGASSATSPTRSTISSRPPCRARLMCSITARPSTPFPCSTRWRFRRERARRSKWSAIDQDCSRMVDTIARSLLLGATLRERRT